MVLRLILTLNIVSLLMLGGEKEIDFMLEFFGVDGSISIFEGEGLFIVGGIELGLFLVVVVVFRGFSQFLASDGTDGQVLLSRIYH